MPYGLRSGGGMMPPNAMNRNRIAQTMMNISRPQPQVGGGMPPGGLPPGGLPPGMMMAPSPLKGLMGMDQQGPSSFMGGQASPQPQLNAMPPGGIPRGMPPNAPPPAMAPSQPMPQQPPPPPADPSSLFAAPPAVPGQTPPGFAKPPQF